MHNTIKLIAVHWFEREEKRKIPDIASPTSISIMLAYAGKSVAFQTRSPRVVMSGYTVESWAEKRLKGFSDSRISAHRGPMSILDSSESLNRLMKVMF